jgi:hypothetical protein
MTKQGPRKYTEGIRWDDLLTTIADLEAEYGCSIYVHLWPMAPGRSNRRWMVRVDAVSIGSPYTARSLCSHHEYWPNGRQLSLTGCVMRCLLEVGGLLAELERPR